MEASKIVIIAAGTGVRHYIDMTFQVILIPNEKGTVAIVFFTNRSIIESGVDNIAGEMLPVFNFVCRKQFIANLKFQKNFNGISLNFH